MIDEAKLNSLLDEFAAAAKESQGAGAAASNPCAVWKSLRPIVVKLITALNALGSLLPKAKLAAKALDALCALLDQLCGTQLGAAAAGGREDALVVQLETALQPQGSQSAAAESPCTVWARARPIVVEAIAALRTFPGASVVVKSG